jgi:site-specific DNA-methyltransferase (adenine-specific)
VLHLATECSNRNHSAAFPVELPSWFIRLFTDRNDVVLDPFIGAGTTAVAAIQEGRKFVGIDTEDDYVELSQERISEIQIKLPAIAEETENYETDV